MENELKARDYTDSTRTVSPLIEAKDAVHLDTTGLSIDDTVDRVMGIVGEKLKQKLESRNLASGRMVDGR